MNHHIEIFYLLIIVILFTTFSCRESTHVLNKSSANEIKCKSSMCFGVYIGPEFVLGSDVAHQFSNKMSIAVGDKLKELYSQEEYSKVDFSNIEMATKGMGSGEVEYMLKVPFKSVQSKCEAYTSFDHVGGWNHEPELVRRVEALNSALLEGDSLNISQKIVTKEGLQEYWIQWRNKDKQKECVQ